jgi:hypothetical protein
MFALLIYTAANPATALANSASSEGKTTKPTQKNSLQKQSAATRVLPPA